MRRISKNNVRALPSILLTAFLLHGCYTAPAPVPAPQRSISERFEQSWQAARGAASDVGVRITFEDRSTGTLRGDQGSSNVVITVITQADASIHVGFAASGGGASQDANLKDHLTRAYQRRMGR
jgi:hypothetical protein